MKTSSVAALSVALCLAAFPRGLRAHDGDFAREAERRLKEATAGEAPGVAVLVARDGKIVFQGGFGYADLEKQEPITLETKFRIGSVSKQFTAAAVARLAEEKTLQLSDKLSKYFPDFPRGDAIELSHLLSHTSGIHSYTDKPEFMKRVRERTTPEELLAWFRDDPPDFEPGKGFHYNNSAYFLLGLIVEKASGMSYGQYLQETFFEPLQMKDTGVYDNAAPPKGMAVGYSYVESKFTPALDWDMSWALGAGSLYSTVGDLFRWNEAYFNGKVLNESSFKAATTPVPLAAGTDGWKYGYGLMMSELKRLPVISHSGGLNGWSSDLMRLPEQRCTVVVLGNALPAPQRLTPAAISRALAEKLLADEIKKLPELVEDSTVDPKSFSEYVGRYDYQSAIMTITSQDNQLFAQLTDQTKHRIYPSAKDQFFWKAVDAQITFVRDEKGNVTAARHSQNGASFQAPRLPEDTVKLTPDEVEPFVGEYQYGPAVMKITQDGAQLYAQLTGQPKFPIFPKSETEFEWRVVKAKVTFLQEDGKVTKAKHEQGGVSFEAPKLK
jgi:CubicO group peptidase (beta-lactamase class C family)